MYAYGQPRPVGGRRRAPHLAFYAEPQVRAELFDAASRLMAGYDLVAAFILLQAANLPVVAPPAVPGQQP